MSRSYVVLLAGLLTLIGAPCVLRAQSTSPEAPVSAQLQPAAAAAASSWSVGVDAGLAVQFSSGSLVTTCKCSYPSATSIGPAAAVSLGYRMTSTLGLTLRVGHAGHEGEHLVTDAREWYDENGAKVLLTHERRALVTMSLLDAALLVSWMPGQEGLALHAGPVLTSVLSAHMRETERIVTPGHVYPDTKTNLVEIADADLASIRPINTTLLGVQVGGEWMIPLAASLAAGPAVSYTLPLTSVFSDGTEWKQHALRAAVRLRLAL